MILPSPKTISGQFVHTIFVLQDSADCSRYQMQLKQTLSLVYNLATISQDALSQKSSYVWSFSLLFGEKLNSFCPISSQSNIYMDLANMGVSRIEILQELFLK